MKKTKIFSTVETLMLLGVDEQKMLKDIIKRNSIVRRHLAGVDPASDEYPKALAKCVIALDGEIADAIGDCITAAHKMLKRAMLPDEIEAVVNE